VGSRRDVGYARCGSGRRVRGTAYVTNDARGTVSVLTTATDAVSATLPVAGPARVAIT